MTILTAVDSDSPHDELLEVGQSLATAFDDELEVLHVMSEARFEELQSYWNESDLSPDIKSDIAMMPGINDRYLASAGDRAIEEGYYLDDAEADARAVAEEAVNGVLGAPDDVRAAGRVGNVVDSILAEAENAQARYLVIGGRHRTPVGKAVLGSTTQSILMQAETSVVTVMEGAVASAGESQPVVAAVDRSDRAARTVRAAGELATALGEELHVVHALTEASFDDMERDTSREPADDGEDEIERAAASIAGQAGEASGADYQAVGLVGKPAREVIRYASEQAASYIVTSGRKRSPVGKVLFGSVTQSILLNADRPVLTLMADD